MCLYSCMHVLVCAWTVRNMEMFTRFFFLSLFSMLTQTVSELGIQRAETIYVWYAGSAQEIAESSAKVCSSLHLYLHMLLIHRKQKSEITTRVMPQPAERLMLQALAIEGIIIRLFCCFFEFFLLVTFCTLASPMQSSIVH